MANNLSRREMLKRAAAAGAATAMSHYALAQNRGEPYTNLSPAEARTLEAVVARLIPSDENGPGALEAGTTRYIDHALDAEIFRYFDPAQGFVVSAPRNAYSAGLAALDAYAQSAAGRPFHELEPVEQDAVLVDLEENRATGFAPTSARFFNLVLGHTLEGTFGDPHYGGNRDFLGWELIGYPGIRLAVTKDQQRMEAKLAPTRIGAYDLSMFDADAAHGGERDGG